MKKKFNYFFAILASCMISICTYSQEQFLTEQEIEEAIVLQELALDENQKMVNTLRDLYSPELEEAAKEELTDKIWYGELMAEVIKLKIKFLNNELEYKIGISERPFYGKTEEVTLYIKE